MNYVLPALLMTASLMGADYVPYDRSAPNEIPFFKAQDKAIEAPKQTPWTLEGYVFGASYHTNRSVNWNETNPGLGIGVAYRAKPWCDALISSGSYTDSFNEQAYFLMFGPRFLIGEDKGFHGSASLSVGYFQGSGQPGYATMPVVSIGYNRVDLCVTGFPAGKSSSHKEVNSDNAKDNRETATGVIACFIKIRLATF